MYAYQMARLLKDKKKLRVLSIGTGEKEFKQIESADDFSMIDALLKVSEFMMNMDTYTAHNYLQWQFQALDRPNDYLRLQTISNLGMDKVD